MRILFNKPCKQCEVYKEQIDYYRKLIDNLLQNKGIAPVISQAEEVLEDDEETKAERARIERGAMRYGD